MLAIIIIVLVLGVILIGLLVSSVVIVRQGEVKVIESFGKYVKTIDPGLHFLIPILYTLYSQRKYFFKTNSFRN